MAMLCRLKLDAAVLVFGPKDAHIVHSWMINLVRARGSGVMSEPDLNKIVGLGFAITGMLALSPFVALAIALAFKALS